MKTLFTGIALLLAANAALADTIDWRKVRVFHDEVSVAQCVFVISVEMGAWASSYTKAGIIKRLRKKTAREGGNAILLHDAEGNWFSGYSGYGDVYLCGEKGGKVSTNSGANN